MTNIKVAIYDVDGVLIDMVHVVYCIAPWLHKIEEYSKTWELFRKLIILFRADKVVDDRLKKTAWASAHFSQEDEESLKIIITNRPFIFGAKRRLIRQLNAVYGENFFLEENIYSSFGKTKAEVVEYFWQPDMYGDMYDDHHGNFKGIPDSIRLHLI